MINRRARIGPKLSLATVTSLGAGAMAMYLLDPQMGRTRRAKLRDQLVKLSNRGTTKFEQKSRYWGARAQGMAERVRHAGSESPPVSDEVLADKVRSEVLTRHQYPRGDINVSAHGGIVELRGQLPDWSDISSLEQDVRKVTGVLDVRNLMHTPDEPPPAIRDALEAQERARP